MENTTLLNAIIEHAIDGIITIGETGCVESINPSACKLFQYAAEEVIGQNISMLIPSDYPCEHDEHLHRYNKTGEKHIIGTVREVEGLKKNGDIFAFKLGVSEVKSAGRKIFTGFIHDISREKEAEKQLKEYAAQLEDEVEKRTNSLKESVGALEKAKEEVHQFLAKEKELSQLKSRFVSMASHEFRTPLSAVQLSAALIDKYAETFHDENVHKHVDKIKSAVTNLTVILNDFLSLEKLEAGRVELNAVNFDLVRFSGAIRQEMQLSARQDQHIYYQHVGPKQFVCLDPDLLKNCIVNLISNAIKYAGENATITVNTNIQPGKVVIVISDDGQGIPEADQKHLFEPFFRAHHTGAIPGTGLGLNIVARYVKLMNGNVEINSKPNNGTQFTLTFKQS